MILENEFVYGCGVVSIACLEDRFLLTLLVDGIRHILRFQAEAVAFVIEYPILSGNRSNERMADP